MAARKARKPTKRSSGRAKPARTSKPRRAAKKTPAARRPKPKRAKPAPKKRPAPSKKPAPKRKVWRSADAADIEKRLRASLGTKVSLKHGKKGGSLTLYYYSDEELDAILDRLL